MLKRLFFFLLVLILSAPQSYGQQYKRMMEDYSINFYTVVDSAEAYFETVDKYKKGSGWKPYMRWKVENEPKYYPSGDRYNVDHNIAYENYTRLLSAKEKDIFGTGWNDLGPYTIETISDQYSVGLGRIEDFYVNNSNDDTVYLVSRSGGFYGTHNGGNTWYGATTDFLPGSGCTAIDASPFGSDTILISLNNANNNYAYGIYRSTDAGLTWQASNFNHTNLPYGGLGSNFRIYTVKYHPTIPGLILIGTNKGLFRTTDNLTTWNLVINNGEYREIDFHPTNPNIVYTYNSLYNQSNPNQILKSINQGANFSLTNVIAGNGGDTDLIMAVSNACANCLYISTGSGIFKSLDEGDNFTFISSPGQGNDGFAVSDVNDNIMLNGALDTYMSTDGGLLFNQTTDWYLGGTNGVGPEMMSYYNTATNYVHADLRNARFVNGKFYVATDGFLCRSADNGISWDKIADSMGVRENYCVGTSQSNHYRSVCGSQDNGTSIRHKGEWIEFFGADGMEGLFHPLNDDWILASYQYGGRLRTKTGGGYAENIDLSAYNDGYWVAPMLVDPNHQMTVYDFRDVLIKTDNFGDNYSFVGDPNFTGEVYNADIAYHNSQIMVVTRNAAIEKSIDGGVNFVSIKNNLPNFSITDVDISPKNDDHIVVTYGDYTNNNQKIYLSTNGGSSWTNITFNLGNMPARSVVFDHSSQENIYVGCEIGIYTMPINGNTWQFYNSDLPNVAIKDLEISWGSNTLKAATWGRGMWEYSLKDRASYPAILSTKIDNLPSLASPKEGVDQYVSSTINYTGNMSSVYTLWSVNSPIFDNVIGMTNISDSTWKTSSPIPDFPVGTDVYFKVMAIGSINDTTETHKFHYTIKPYELCEASGNFAGEGFFIQNVNLKNINNNSGDDAYSWYDQQLAYLHPDSTYNLSISANTGWGDNDYAAWIDFDNDLDFEENEQILYSVNAGVSTVNNSFVIPAIANLNDTLRMRVRLAYWGGNPEPCGVTYGEVEDYMIRIADENTLATQEIELDNLALYPNPNNGEFVIKSDTKLNQVQISIYTLDGRIVSEKSYENTDTFKCDTNLTAGNYIVSLKSGEVSKNFSIIVR